MADEYIRSLRPLVPACRETVTAGIELVVSRYEKRKSYPFIDTKLSTLTGKDFAEEETETDFKSRSAVFGWIQGRGLEALAGHAAFLSDNPELSQRCDRMLSAVSAQIAALGKKENGRFMFLSAPDGLPFRCGPDGKREYFSAWDIPPGFADIFTGKGLAAAGTRLKKPELADLGISTLNNTFQALKFGTFASDQISFDPKNPVRPAVNRQAQGPWMIMLGGFALFCELFPETWEWRESGYECLSRLLERHTAQKDSGPLKRYDFFEFIDNDNKPCVDSGEILQDPGHALEFTGLAARFLLKAGSKLAYHPGRRDFINNCKAILPEIFLSAFRNGFRKDAGGICKTFDLVSRKPVNDDMPWWPLPEAMRAAALLLLLCPDYPRRAEIAETAQTCARAFFVGFRSNVPGLFIQTRAADGRPSTAIPATPDADPGYHTGLSLIDLIKTCEETFAGGDKIVLR